MIIPVILSGGSGSRLWPLSRETYPKQFLPLADERTMVQNTALRIAGLGGVAAPMVVCNEDHRFMVAEQLRAVGIHPSAVIDATAVVDPGAHVGPLVVVGARSRIAAGAIIGPGCVVGEDCVVGDGSELVARVTLVVRVCLGKRVLVHPGAVLGADGFGIAMDHGQWLKVPQLGGVVVGDDCEIGANTTIDRGALEDTVLEQDVRLDNQIQVGHNVRIGAHTAMAGCSAVAGSATIGRHCLVGGGAGILGHLEVCDRVVVTAMSLVTHSIREPGEYSSGTPLMDNRSWRRSAARFKQLDRIARRAGPGEKDPE